MAETDLTVDSQGLPLEEPHGSSALPDAARPVPAPAGLTRPGGAVAARPLHFFWLADCSGSMAQDGRIQALNNAAEEALPHMRRVASENPNVEVLVRVMRFSTGATWLDEAAVPLGRFVWPRLQADGMTDLGAALRKLTIELRASVMPPRSLAPVVVLLSDGWPTDDFDVALAELFAEPWGRRAVRLAVAIGRDADREALRQFIGDPRVLPLEANSPEALARQIRWASTVGIDAASAPRVGMVGEGHQVESAPRPLGPSTGRVDEIEIW